MEKELFEIINLVFNGLIMVTGFSAIGLYLYQKRVEKRTAATLVLTQIDNIQENIKKLRENPKLDEVTVFKSKQILARNHWEENRHILSKRLGERNVRLIEDFYSLAEELERAQKAIIYEITTTWENKDYIYQEKVLEEIYNDHNFNVLKDSPLDLFGRFGHGFSAAIPLNMVYENLARYKSLSGTVAYDKLWKISYHS